MVVEIVVSIIIDRLHFIFTLEITFNGPYYRVSLHLLS